MGTRSGRGRRSGTAIVVVMGLLVLVGMMIYRMAGRSQAQARLTHVLNTDAEHLYRAEAVFSQLVNRLKKRPWEVRFYAEGGNGTGPYSEEISGEYREGSYRAWVQDVPVDGVGAVPGLVDFFLRMTYEGRVRQFHYRMVMRGRTLRREPSIDIVHFGRTGEDVTAADGRAREGGRVTDETRLAERVRAASHAGVLTLPEPLLETFESGDGESAGAAQTAVQVAAHLDRETSEGRGDRLAAAERDLRAAIHLLGEDGVHFEGLLPPIERGRFRHRVADYPAAHDRLDRVIASDAPLRTKLQALAVKIRALQSQGWRRGPASDEGHELLREGWRALEQAAALLEGSTPAERAGAGLTLQATLALDEMRQAILSGGAGLEGEEDWSVREAAALQRFDQLVADRRLFGGEQAPADVQEHTLAPLRTVPALVRMGSASPLPSSGFAPVDPAEVDGFVADSGGSWAGWPTDTGRDQPFWDRTWAEQDGREGEGGSGEPSPYPDLDGDGVPDLVADPALLDADGDGVPDAVAGDLAAQNCIESCGGGSDDDDDDGCVKSCQRGIRDASEIDAAYYSGRRDGYLTRLAARFERWGAGVRNLSINEVRSEFDRHAGIQGCHITCLENGGTGPACTGQCQGIVARTRDTCRGLCPQGRGRGHGMCLYQCHKGDLPGAPDPTGATDHAAPPGATQANGAPADWAARVNQPDEATDGTAQGCHTACEWGLYEGARPGYTNCMRQCSGIRTAPQPKTEDIPHLRPRSTVSDSGRECDRQSGNAGIRCHLQKSGLDTIAWRWR